MPPPNKKYPGWTSVTALFLSHIKLVMLFVLIAALIALSRAGRKPVMGTRA